MTDSTILPYPENPQHVDNLNTIHKLELMGFDGSDASLTISLFEYDMVWLEIPERLRSDPDEDYLFVYHVGCNADGHKVFSRSTMFSSQFDNDINWISKHDMDSFMSCHGTSFEAWMQKPYPERVHDLFSYFGHQNVFGEGGLTFEIRDPDHDYGSSPMPGETPDDYYSRLAHGEPDSGEPWIPGEFLREEDEIYFVSPDFGNWLCQWHNGMDAIYAAGSSVIANRGVPLDVVEDAIALMERNISALSARAKPDTDDRNKEYDAVQARVLRDIMQQALRAGPSDEPQHAEL